MNGIASILDSNFFGALTGAGITGIITIIIFYIDKKYSKKERELEKAKNKTKYQVFFRTKCKQIIFVGDSIIFFKGLMDRHHYYNIDPVEEINENIRELEEIASSLTNSNLDQVVTELYELTESIMEYVNNISINFEGVLATDEEDHTNLVDLMDSNTQKLVKLIKDEVLENHQ